MASFFNSLCLDLSQLGRSLAWTLRLGFHLGLTLQLDALRRPHFRPVDFSSIVAPS